MRGMRKCNFSVRRFFQRQGNHLCSSQRLLNSYHCRLYLLKNVYSISFTVTARYLPGRSLLLEQFSHRRGRRELDDDEEGYDGGGIGRHKRVGRMVVRTPGSGTRERDRVFLNKKLHSHVYVRENAVPVGGPYRSPASPTLPIVSR